MDGEGKIVLVLGGARSGKSEFAEKYVLHAGAVCGYIATAEILDAEMAERVRLHRERRKKRWITFEAPYHAEDVFPEAGARTDAILFDDITLYLSNMLYGNNAPEGSTAEKGGYVKKQIALLLDAAKKCCRRRYLLRVFNLTQPAASFPLKCSLGAVLNLNKFGI